jgi:drug/metabolite transporter (DMT)-like permease
MPSESTAPEATGAVQAADGAAALEAVRLHQQMTFARRGLIWAAISGLTWGVVGVLLGLALTLPPFSHVRSGSSAFWGLLVAPLVGACLHDTFAALWLLAYNVSTGRRKEYLRTAGTLPGVMICLGGVFGGPVFMSGYLISIRLSGSFYALAITATFPIIGALLAAQILKEKTGVRLWAGIVLCMAGAILVGYVAPENNAHPYFYIGLAAALVAAVGLSLEGILSTIGMDLVDANVAMGIRQITSSTIYLAIILPVVSGSGMLVEAAHHRSFLVLAVAGIIGGYSFQTWYRGMNMAGVSRTMALNITYALWGMLFGWAFTGQAVAGNLLIGAVLITAGAIITVLNPKEFLVLRKVDRHEAAVEIQNPSIDRE